MTIFFVFFFLSIAGHMEIARTKPREIEERSSAARGGVCRRTRMKTSIEVAFVLSPGLECKFILLICHGIKTTYSDVPLFCLCYRPTFEGDANYESLQIIQPLSRIHKVINFSKIFSFVTSKANLN